MKSVALYGFAAETRDGIWQTRADQIWSITWAYKYDLPRIDRLLEIHPIWIQARSKKPEYQKPRDHWEWLKKNHKIPVVMLVKHPEVPMCERYPLEQVQALLPQDRRSKVLTSSFDYLMALAVLEGYERIEVYGFEMGSDTEYRYQREGAAYWIAQCDARGIDLVLPVNTALLRNKLYGYEGGSMIYRQDLERLRMDREKQKVESFAKLSYLEGRMREAKEAGDEERAADIASMWDKQYRICLVISGALQECEYLLKEIDLEEPKDLLIDPMGTVQIGEL